MVRPGLFLGTAGRNTPEIPCDAKSAIVKERVEKTGAGGRTRTALAVLVMAAVLWPAAALAGGEVGLEARGVDPWASLRNRWGLDVRDEMNRPVSARQIESQLKAASALAAQQTSFVSRLPSASLHIRLAEMLAALKDIIKPLVPSGGKHEVWALPVPGIVRLILLLLPVVSPLTSSAPAGTARAEATASRSRLPLVLRC